MTTSLSLDELLEVLRGSECRFDPDLTLYLKPHPKTYPDEVKQALREHLGWLIHLLIPVDFIDYRPRAFWEQRNQVRGCYACGRSCVTLDPLGMPRHPWCGWTTQHGQASAGPAPGYPKHLAADSARIAPKWKPDYPIGNCSCGRESIRLYGKRCYWCAQEQAIG